MIFDLLDKLNIDSSFTDNINESKYIEKFKQTNQINLTNHVKFSNFAPFIISIYDPLYEHIEDNEKKMYMKKKIPEICSEIEEKSDIKYNNYKFNEKLMKPSLIQFGLQVWEGDKNYISSICYLNEYYGQHFVIVYENIAYETCIKNYPKVYLNYKNHIQIIQGDFLLGNLDDLFNKISLENDIKKEIKSVYKMPLNPISKYKIEELKVLAKECNISLKDGTKNKVKAVLYDEINNYKLNN